MRFKIVILTVFCLFSFSKLSLSDSVKAQWRQAEDLRLEYKLEQSQELLEELIKNNPDFAPAYISLAYIKYNFHQYKQVLKLAETVINLAPDQVSDSDRAKAYLIFGGAKGMIAHFGGPTVKLIYGPQIFPNLKKAQKLLPDSADVYFGLGVFYLLAPAVVGGDIKRAEEYLKQAIELDPKLADAYVRLAQVYKARGDIDKFNLYLDQALQLDPNNFLAKDIKGNSCRFVCIDGK